MQCFVCGKEIEKGKYCSISCKNKRFKKNCLICGKEFFGTKQKLFCSNDCRRLGKDISNEKRKKTNIKKYGHECALSNKEVQDKKKKTCIEKYGKENYSQTEEYRQKTESTNLKKFGTKYATQNKDIVDKIRENNIKNYGVSHPNKLEEKKKQVEENNIKKYGVKSTNQLENVKQKKKESFIKKFGVDNPNKSLVIREKSKKTNIEKYGAPNPFQSEIIKEKIKDYNFKKYGKEYYSQTDEMKNKSKATCLQKYGKEYYSQTEEYKNKVRESNFNRYGVYCSTQKHIVNYENFNENFIRENFIKDNLFYMEEFLEYFNLSTISDGGNKIKKRFNITESNFFSNKYRKSQFEIYNFINSIFDFDIIFNDKKTIQPLELDINVLCKNVAFEYDGLMFHSEGKSEYSLFQNFNDTYHLNKTQLCEEKGVKLFHIFENEWKDKNKQEIWKSVIKNSLGYSDRKIFGRKCSIRQINQDELFPFLIENHLQGPALSSINYGLYYGDELVSVMTFGKSRFNKNYDWELIRFCNKINTNVVGSFSKLLKHFKKRNTGTIISYGNRRWVSSLNNVYSKNGGKLIKVSKPNYYYFDSHKKNPVLESRLKYQKHKLKDILENFDEKLTESENMYNNGYRKIYDCGNLVYEL